MMRNFDGKRGKLGVVGEMQHLSLQYRHDDLLESFLQSGIGIHTVGGVSCIVITSDFQNTSPFIDIEADRALVSQLHLWEIDVENAAEVKGIRKLMAFDLRSNRHQNFE